SRARRISPSSDAQSIVEIRQSVLIGEETTGDGLANATGKGASQHAELAYVDLVSGIFSEDMAKPVQRHNCRIRNPVAATESSVKLGCVYGTGH
ncbi:MAG TPA: hypothetical protein PK586_15650, partial [Casimicrobium sp.]|nr:hypothetical protein [Casimicrobium sp.]